MTNYKVVRTNIFDENFKKLDNSIKILILKYLKKLETTANPKAYGKELGGNLTGLYRFKVSNYRIIASIEDEKLVICTLTVGHRSTIYKRFRIL